MFLRPALAVLCLPLALLVACGGDPPEDPLICPVGTTIRNGSCVANGSDAAVDGGGEDVVPGQDTGFVDAGDPDSGVIPDSGVGTDAQPGDALPTDAGEGVALLSMAALDFGRTVLNEVVTSEVEVSNPGTVPVLIRTGLISGGAAPDYSVVASSTIGASGLTLAPGDRVTLSFTFQPRAVGVRNAALSISLCAAGCDQSLSLTGEGLLDALECAPTLIDFGLVSPNSCARTPVDCNNVSSHDATITSFGFASGSAPTFAVTSTGTPPYLVPGAGSQSFTVAYCPAAVGRQTGTLEIQVQHPDPVRRTKSIALAGTGGGPNIACLPTTVDFGVAGIGQSRTRNLVCSNDGDAPLTISGVALGVGASASFQFSAPSLPGTIAPAGTFTIAIEYAPVAAGLDQGTIEVASNDRDTPVMVVPVLGEAILPNGCSLAITPGTIELGAVRLNTTAQGTALVSNLGSGTCGVTVNGLSAATGPAYTLLSGPGFQLSPGASQLLEVSFTPTAAQAYPGAIELSTTDLSLPNPSVVLSGTGAGPAYPLSLNPTSLDFGVIAPACAAAATRTLVVRNGGAATLALTMDFGTPAPSEFTVDGVPSLSFSLPSNGTRSVIVGFLPAAAGAYQARLSLRATGLAPLFLPVSGESAATPQNVETFTSGGPGVIDVLIVVDDSGSMGEEQARLAAAAPTLLGRGDAAGADYHVAVTTTDPGPTPFPIGTLRGAPTYVTSISPSRVADLAASINQGTLGSGIEEGLAAATAAVTNPTLLGGSNAGFLRAGAELAVLVISDEEDQSPDLVSTYLQALAARPIGLPSSARVFGITGGPQGCNGVAGLADAEQRYSQAASQTGGFIRSICELDHTPILAELGDAIFQGARASYQLASRPAPNSVEVRVGGVLLPAQSGNATNWGLDYAGARLIFVGGAPAAGSTIEVRYTSVCVPATCGNGALQGGEQCDDGNAINTDACLQTCYLASCGDGFTQAGGEQCDDGNTVPGDGCNQTCIIEGCGNGFLEPPETCDNGSNNSDTTPNACRTDCRPAYCHDGVVDQGEVCDDGNLSDTDACVGVCVAARCGDGLVRAGVEQCDDGNTVDTDLCSNACVFNLSSFTVTSQAVPYAATAGGTAVVGLTDENFISVPMGFPFSFLGTAVTNLSVNANGVITFDQATAVSYLNAAIPSTAAPNGFLAWWWDDLDLGRVVNGTSASVTHQILGSSPSRIHVLTFQNVPFYLAGDTLLNVELRFFETSNVITVHYGPATGTGAAYSATVGWEGPTGQIGADVLGCGATCSAIEWPAGIRYTYTP